LLFISLLAFTAKAL